ncbi:uncharacterized protein LOC134780821 [Penaeus indicus]|uniref:uncharacterized protein LOC134780821 n=1 Tax=Penaeus indicus TaxID=29960 RepID=UPI00300CB724
MDATSYTDLEALTVVWALKHFKEIILGYDIHVLTDHRPLKYILTDSRHVKGRQSRWVDTLLEFHPKIDYSPGSANKPLELQAKRRDDPLYVDIFAHLEDNTKPLPTNRNLPIEELYLRNGLLFRKSAPKKLCGSKQSHTYHQLVIPEVFVPTALNLLYNSHTSGHQGIFKTLQLARSHYYFPRFGPRVIGHIKSCQIYPLYKGHTVAPVPALTYDTPERPFFRVSMDVLSGFTPTENRNCHMVVMIESFSHYTKFAPIPDKNAKTVAHAFFSHVICRHGAPEQLVPQANGLVERLNRTILNVLRISINTQDNKWDLWIPITQAAINSTFHSSLGDIPNYVVYGDDRRFTYELLQQLQLLLSTETTTGRSQAWYHFDTLKLASTQYEDRFNQQRPSPVSLLQILLLIQSCYFVATVFPRLRLPWSSTDAFCPEMTKTSIPRPAQSWVTLHPRHISPAASYLPPAHYAGTESPCIPAVETSPSAHPLQQDRGRS